MQLSPYINIELTHPVWRMQIDEQEDILCLETRDVANKAAAFTTIDVRHGRILFKNKTLPNGWLCGLEVAAFGVMLVHGYQSENLPVRKGLMAIDAKTGDLLWENHNLNFESVATTDFRVYDLRIQPKRISVIDAKAGTALSNAPVIDEQASSILFPESVVDDTVHKLGIPDISMPHTALLLSHNGYIIVSLHALSAGVVNQFLYVIDSNRNVVFKDIIATDIQKLQPEAFIVFKQKLIWLQNRSVVKVLHL
ncbi:DUF4905 domain-containing protein [Mucilaginibacter ginkgonis]|uniref:DUF4905 domain-containing protein n=1 Tax=Mucilaginibacter ginkgonis TaxID=2682091 RepID=A0A6I4HXA6_9SPHI|nr:DUF4905 domain-containing protein [Mucilaginibacter ginkgonis]QQL50989.1 DUF4905 domain-containing protein [Mucilaginibacter ginkgonis]